MQSARLRAERGLVFAALVLVASAACQAEPPKPAVIDAAAYPDLQAALDAVLEGGGDATVGENLVAPDARDEAKEGQP